MNANTRTHGHSYAKSVLSVFVALLLVLSVAGLFEMMLMSYQIFSIKL